MGSVLEELSSALGIFDPVVGTAHTGLMFSCCVLVPGSVILVLVNSSFL